MNKDTLMNSTEFCYWLQGFFELQNPVTLSPEQVLIIKEHLNLVFNKVTTANIKNSFTPFYHGLSEGILECNDNPQFLVYKHEASC